MRTPPVDGTGFAMDIRSYFPVKRLRCDDDAPIITGPKDLPSEQQSDMVARAGVSTAASCIMRVVWSLRAALKWLRQTRFNATVARAVTRTPQGSEQSVDGRPCVLCDCHAEPNTVLCAGHRHRLCRGVRGQCPYWNKFHVSSKLHRCNGCAKTFLSLYKPFLIFHCKGCGTTKHGTEFSVAWTGTSVDLTCYACKAVKRAARVCTCDGFIATKVSDCRASSRRRNAKGRNHDFDIDIPFMKDLFTKQCGRCALSGIVMATAPMTHWQASIDRIDTDIGYVHSNVRWVCLEFNGKAQWTPAKIKLARAVPLENTIDVDATCTSMREKPSWVGRPGFRKSKEKLRTQRCSTTGVVLHECRSCDQYLPVDAFTKHINKGCKQCQAVQQRAYRKTPRGTVISAFKHAQHHSEERKRKRSFRDDSDPFTLTFEDVVDCYAAQRGLCAYSGLPLQFHGDWMLSLERLDPLKNYSANNCVLVCHEFNATDHSSRREGVYSLGWSIEKMRVFRSV